MEFNPSKSEVLHFGKGKKTINSMTLNGIDVRRILGVQVLSSWKDTTQLDRMVKTVYSMLTSIGRGIE